MKCPAPNSLIFAILMLVNRGLLGLMFLFAGVGKIKGGVGSFYKEGFLPMKPSWLPEVMARPYGYALPFAELIFGAMLVLGLVSRTAAGVIFLMLMSFSIALMVKSGDLSGGGHTTIHTNVNFAALALLLIFTGPGGISVDAIWSKHSRIR